MQEFSSINVSSYEAASLADKLNEESNDGWNVVAIVPTGSTITAYLSRERDRADDADTSTGALVETADEPSTDVATAAPAAAVAGMAASEATPDIAPDIAPDEPSVIPAAAATAAVEPEPAAPAEPAAAGAEPAGWYADPSARYELRYWDGSQWTEHVSRSGQQYTDPPVA